MREPGDQRRRPGCSYGHWEADGRSQEKLTYEPERHRCGDNTKFDRDPKNGADKGQVAGLALDFEDSTRG